MIKILKKSIKKTLNLVGIDIIKLSKSPSYTLIGLKNLPIKTIIDVGANTGQFARMIMQIFPDAQIYCFEPIDEAFEKLENLSKRYARLKPIKIALGDVEGYVNMFKHSNHTPSSSLLRTTRICENFYPFTKKKKEVNVKLNTLDKWVQEFKPDLTPEVLIKLDVQGYEDRVIKGGIETFKKAKACIIEVCLDELYEEQADLKNLYIMLNELGFRYAGNLQQTYGTDGHVIYIDGVFIKY